MPSLRSLPRLLKGFLVLLLLSTALRAQAAEAPIPDGRELPEIRIGYIEASSRLSAKITLSLLERL